MNTIRRGKIKDATEVHSLHDGKSLVGFEIEIVDDTGGGTGGYYIYYNDPKETRGRGYDEWYETKDIMEDVLRRKVNKGMVIEWEE